jgi:hypothetical protein
VLYTADVRGTDTRDWRCGSSDLSDPVCGRTRRTAQCAPGSTRATAATSGECEEIDGRWARAFVARNPAPNVLTQALWIDADSLLPLRWDASYPADPDRGIPAKPYTRVWFGYDASVDVRPPDGITPPDCIR